MQWPANFFKGKKNRDRDRTCANRIQKSLLCSKIDEGIESRWKPRTAQFPGEIPKSWEGGEGPAAACQLQRTVAVCREIQLSRAWALVMGKERARNYANVAGRNARVCLQASRSAASAGRGKKPATPVVVAINRRPVNYLVG